MIKVSSRGSFDKSLTFLRRMQQRQQFAGLAQFGPMGVEVLQRATPKESAETANAWYYEIVDRPGYFAIRWHNSHITKQGDPIAVLLQYGHATGNGGYVQGRDYINPAIQPIFDQIADSMWKEVTK